MSKKDQVHFYNLLPKIRKCKLFGTRLIDAAIRGDFQKGTIIEIIRSQPGIEELTLEGWLDLCLGREELS